MSKSVYIKRIGRGLKPLKSIEEEAAVSLDEYIDSETNESFYEIVVGTKDEEISINRNIDMDGNVHFTASYYNSKKGKYMFIHCNPDEAEDCIKNDPTSLYNLVFERDNEEQNNSDFDNVRGYEA